jgi:hypothetical protein
MTAKLLLAIVLTAALLGCATKPVGRTLKCEGQNCDVQVSVTCTLRVFCIASVDYDEIQVPRGQSPNITWQMMSPGYTFPGNGIVIANAGDEFSCRVEANGQRFTCRNRHSVRGAYKYTVNVSGTPHVPSLDPWILND